jgi:nucleotide-binding universal stress UspA family protein
VIRRVRERLLAAVEPLAISADRVHSPTGRAVASIIELTQRLQCDLLVVGTHEKHGRRLFGSVAYALANRSPCDIWFVAPG